MVCKVGGDLHIHDHFWGMSGILYANFDPVYNKATVSPKGMGSLYVNCYCQYALCW